MPENKDILKELDLLFNDYEDLERSLYLDIKALMEQGITYSITRLTLSDKKETFVPLNMIKPFFKIFHNDQYHGLYQAKYKKRPVLLSFRSELDMMPVCLVDQVEFKISQSGQDLWTFTGFVSELLKPSQVQIKNKKLPLTFHLKLIDSSNRGNLEREMDSHIFLSNKLEHEKYSMQQSSFPVKNMCAILAQKNKIPNLKESQISLNHLQAYSRDVLVLSRIIEQLKYDRVNDLDTQGMKKYRRQLEVLQGTLTSHFNFDSTAIVLNFKK
jgi:hypothetical protein